MRLEISLTFGIMVAMKIMILSRRPRVFIETSSYFAMERIITTPLRWKLGGMRQWTATSRYNWQAEFRSEQKWGKLSVTNMNWCQKTEHLPPVHWGGLFILAFREKPPLFRNLSRILLLLCNYWGPIPEVQRSWKDNRLSTQLFHNKQWDKGVRAAKKTQASALMRQIWRGIDHHNEKHASIILADQFIQDDAISESCFCCPNLLC